MFAETWAAAADALARDPALALAPLRALRDRRFVRPRPGANGWPDAAVPTLFAALDASRSCAAASPTLAGELWGAAAGLLAAWARWHAPRSVVSETNAETNAAAAATLSRVVDVVAAARDAFSSVFSGSFHVPGGPLGPMPALCLACVAASPAAPRETRARALASALETLNRLAPENAFASAAEARALAASFAYACAAAEDLHMCVTHAVSVESSLDAHGDAHGDVPGSGWIDATSLARVFFPLWRGVGKPFASGAENLSAAAQRAGLLLARAAHATARRSFPRIAASLARNARDVLVRSERLLGEPRGSSPLAIPPCHSGAAFVAAGTLLACRRPVPDGAEATALDGYVSQSAKNATALDVGALRVAEAHAAEAVVAAAAVSAALAADDALADAVADAVADASSRDAVSFEGVSNHEAWSALAAGALSASRCVAERAFDSDASSFVWANTHAIDIDATRRVGKQTCFFAVVSGAYRFAAAPLLVAAKCARARTDPASASAAVAAARAAPLAARAHALIDLACGELARTGRTSRREGSFFEGERSSFALSPKELFRFAARATCRFARDAHEGYAFFLASTPAEWRGALDAASVWPALADARLAVVVACEHLTALALEEEDPDRDTRARSGNDIETLRVSLSVAACDALAYVEFARGPAFDAHMSRRGQIETRAVHRAQMGSARYALALTRLAAALGADSPAGAALRKRFALESVPEVPEGSPPSASLALASLVPRDSRANVFLRLVPYFASGAFGNAPGSLVTARALPLALHYVSHQSPGFARAAHLALAASFRAAPAATVPDAFAPYVERSLERLYASGGVFSSLDAARALAPVEEAFASTVLVVAECGGATRRSRDAVAAVARALVERAKRLDAFSSDVDTNAENANQHAEHARTKNAKNARTLRRLVFALLPLVDHALVPDVQSAAEDAVLSVRPHRRAADEEGNGGAVAPRLAAYADLVRSVMAIGDVARKGAATQWALRLRARL